MLKRLSHLPRNWFVQTQVSVALRPMLFTIRLQETSWLPCVDHLPCLSPAPPRQMPLVWMQGSALWKARWSSGSQAGSSGSEGFPLSYSFQVMIPSSVGCILGLILSLQEERTPTMGNRHILKPVSHYTHTHQLPCKQLSHFLGACLLWSNSWCY